MKKNIWSCIIALCLMASIGLHLTGCTASVQAVDLMAGISPGEVEGKDADESFRLSQMDLALKLLRESVKKENEENLLISPLSVELALAITANGAAGETRREMETLLSGDLPLELLNEYLYTYIENLPSGDNSKLHIANSIWYRDEENRLTVEEAFLQTNGDYYGAEVYKAPFDGQTVKDINNWVSRETEGMIDSLVEEIPEDTIMYLINALTFDAKWADPYKKSEVGERTFYTMDGNEVPVEMMYSTEWQYLDSPTATGFLKEYKGGSYTFAALLPKNGMDIYEYVNTMDPESLLAMLDEPKSEGGQAGLPKFTFDYEISLKGALEDLGMIEAFSGEKADFSSMAHSANGNIYISDVFHKTHIQIDEEGTKAAAATQVSIVEECAPVSEWSVILDRPFVFMILDQNANLPVFMGLVLDPTK